MVLLESAEIGGATCATLLVQLYANHGERAISPVMSASNASRNFSGRREIARMDAPSSLNAFCEGENDLANAVVNGGVTAITNTLEMFIELPVTHHSIRQRERL